MSDLLDALVARGIRFRRNMSDLNEYTICCPFCFETRFRLGFNVAKDLGHCFNCSYRSRHVIEDLTEALDLGVLSATQAFPNAQGEERLPSLPEDFALLSEPANGPLERKALCYLRKRCVEDWQISEKKIGVSLTGQYAYRIVFPVYYGKKLQGLVTRDFTDQQERKYLNSSGMKAVYNSPVRRKNKAVLCEGIFDCLALERALSRENYDVLALLGHGLTESQEVRLKGYEDVILWPDADIPGVKGFLDIGRHLVLYHNVLIVPPRGSAKDAGDMAVNELAALWSKREVLTESLALKLTVEVAFRE